MLNYRNVKSLKGTTIPWGEIALQITPADAFLLPAELRRKEMGFKCDPGAA